MALGKKGAPLPANDARRVAARVPLGELAAGRKGWIRELRGGKEFSQRVVALGFTLGAEVVVLQNYGQGPMIVSVRDCQVALGRGEGSKIVVEVR